jgi:hypothetical protein
MKGTDKDSTVYAHCSSCGAKTWINEWSRLCGECLPEKMKGGSGTSFKTPKNFDAKTRKKYKQLDKKLLKEGLHQNAGGGKQFQPGAEEMDRGYTLPDEEAKSLRGLAGEDEVNDNVPVSAPLRMNQPGKAGIGFDYMGDVEPTRPKEPSHERRKRYRKGSKPKPKQQFSDEQIARVRDEQRELGDRSPAGSKKRFELEMMLWNSYGRVPKEFAAYIEELYRKAGVELGQRKVATLRMFGDARGRGGTYKALSNKEIAEKLGLFKKVKGKDEPDSDKVANDLKAVRGKLLNPPEEWEEGNKMVADVARRALSPQFRRTAIKNELSKKLADELIGVISKLSLKGYRPSAAMVREKGMNVALKIIDEEGRHARKVVIEGPVGKDFHHVPTSDPDGKIAEFIERTGPLPPIKSPRGGRVRFEFPDHPELTPVIEELLEAEVEEKPKKPKGRRRPKIK